MQVVMTEAAAVHHAGDAAGAVESRGLCEPVGCASAQQHGAHQPHARGRCGARRAGQCRLRCQAAARPRRRSAQPLVPGAADRALPAAGGAGDEPRDVGASGHAAQLRAAARRRRHRARPGRGRPGLRRDRRRPHARARGTARGTDRLLPAQGAAGQAHAHHRRPDLRADRPGARHHQLSSGKMGFAIARAAAEAGAEVTLVAGPVHLPTPRHVRRIDVRTAQQMHDAVLPVAAHHDVFVATAAVADWRRRISPNTRSRRTARSSRRASS